MSRSGATIDRSSSIRITRIAREHERDDEVRSPIDGVVGVERDRGRAADEHVVGATVVELRAQVGTAASAASESAASAEGRLQLHPPVDDGRLAGAGVPGGPNGWTPSSVTGSAPLGESSRHHGDGVDARRWRAHVGHRPAALLGAMTTAGVPEPPGKCSPSSACPSRACDSPSTNSLDGTPSAFELQRIPRASDAPAPRAVETTRRQRAAVARSRRATPGQSAAAPDAGRRPRRATRLALAAARGQNADPPRPEEQRGQERQRGEQGEHDADRGDRAEHLVRGQLAHEQASGARR